MFTLSRFTRTFALALTLLTPHLAAAQAQTPPAPPATPAPAPTPPITAGWQDGFVLQAPNGDFRLVLGIMGQADGRFVLDDDSSIINTFTLRRLRPSFAGRVGKFFDFKVTPEFGAGSTSVVDAY